MNELELIKELRSMTGAGLNDIKKALAESGGNREKALQALRVMGKSVAQKKSSRLAKEGIIEAYIHSNRKIGVLLEIRCETDFVARNEEFQKFAHEVAMQIAATDPKYLSSEEIPPEIVEEEKKIFLQQIDTTKPANVAEQILKGKLEKRWSELCLMSQPYIRDSDKTIKDLLTESIAKIGENIEIGKFVRFEI